MASADVWSALPNTAWSNSCFGTPAFSRAHFDASAARSIAVKSFSVPPNVPNGVRTPLRKTTSVSLPWVFMPGKILEVLHVPHDAEDEGREQAHHDDDRRRDPVVRRGRLRVQHGALRGVDVGAFGGAQV